MSKDDVPSSKKVHTIKAETEDGEIDRRRMVLGSARHRSERVCKTSPAGDGSSEDSSMLKSAKWLEGKER